ncbi:DoxX family membrane protein [Natronomonas sp. EA1]|uniref:DoxX family membrane protein n=1 Tax=Natronomonas sp. EA1 TaxID=3421655 RepID=UPI003EBF1D26
MHRTRLRVLALAGTLTLAGTASAHVDYVTEDPAPVESAVAYLVEALTNPVVAGLLAGGAVAALLAVAVYLRFVAPLPDIPVLRETLRGYRPLVPWMLRLSMGLPLVGAGFAGYFFSPAVEVPGMRIPQVFVGFLLLFGLGTRVVAALGLLLYLGSLPFYPRLALAIEYVPGLLAVVLVGGGKPSADHMFAQVANAPGTLYGRIEPVRAVAARVVPAIERYERYAPTILRVGLGVGFLYLGIVEKLADPAHALAVVAKYDLTAVVPVPADAWVVGAALAEVGLGVLLVLGVFTRGAAATAFLVFTLTLFGLPDDPVLAHVTLFGLASAVFTLGPGPLAVDHRLDGLRARVPLLGTATAER